MLRPYIALCPLPSALCPLPVTRVLYLDRYHLGDPLFLTGLARDLAAGGPPTILVHGAAEDGERALEAGGRFPVWEGDVLAAPTLEEAMTVERAGRDLNRRIAHALNESGAAAVRMDGASRGLFSVDPAGVRVGDLGWVEALLRQRAVPVVLALSPDGEGPLRQVSGGRLAAALAAALPEGEATFLARKPLAEGEVLRLAEIPPDALGEREAVAQALAAGAMPRTVSPRDLRRPDARGARLTG